MLCQGFYFAVCFTCLLSIETCFNRSRLSQGNIAKLCVYFNRICRPCSPLMMCFWCKRLSCFIHALISSEVNYAANDRNDENTEEAGISYKYSVIHPSRRNTWLLWYNLMWIFVSNNFYKSNIKFFMFNKVFSLDIYVIQYLNIILWFKIKYLDKSDLFYVSTTLKDRFNA